MTQAATLAQLASSGALSADTSGNVGIGTTTPLTRLDLGSIVHGTPGTGVTASMWKDGASNFFGFGVSAGQLNYIAGTNTANSHVFFTNNAERMRIDSSGNVLVGTTGVVGLVTTSQSATASPSVSARVTSTSFTNDVVQIYCARDTNNASYNYITASRPAGTSFIVRDSGNVLNANNSYGSLSDQRIKENIIDATPKLEKINQVRVVNFNMIGDEQKQIGVVAQELEQIFPNMVEEDQEGTKSVKYSVFVPMLIKAIQELKAELDVCKAEIAALKGV